MSTLVIMLGLAAMIGFSGEQALRFLENQRTGMIATSTTQLEESLVQSLQVSYYEEYRRVAGDATGSKILTQAELNSIVQQAYSRLGISGNADTAVTIPHASGSEVQSTIQCDFPIAATNIDTQATTPYSSIQGTFSWLDGISAVQKSIEVTITLSGKNSFSGKIYQTSHHYLLNLLEIPVENLSLSSLGNVTLPNMALTAGSGYFGGVIQGGNGVQFQDRFIAGNRSSSAVTIPGNHENLNPKWSERGYTEIVSTNTVRNLETQRAPALGTSIKGSYFFREGLASSGGFSAEEQSQIKSFQPYYQVPVAQRIYGIHNPSATDETLAFALHSGSGDEQNSSTLPLWVTVHLQTNSTPKVQFRVDLSLIPADASNEISVFVGSRNNSLSGNFSQAEVVILPWETVPPHLKVTVISPNPIVLTGNFNQGTPAASAHFFANQVFYGTTPANQLDFEGSYSNYQQKPGGSRIDFRSSSGISPTSPNIRLIPTPTGTIRSHHHYYYLVIKSKII